MCASFVQGFHQVWSMLAYVDQQDPMQSEYFSTSSLSIMCNYVVGTVCELAAWFTPFPSAAPPARPGFDTHTSSQRTIFPIATLSPYGNK